MLTFERPGVFNGRAFNSESWYVVDPAYAEFEQQVIAEWRARYRPTNRPGWVRPVLFTLLPLLTLGIAFASIIASPNDTRFVFPMALVIGLAVVIIGFRLADIRWPGTAAVEGHIHSVVPVPAEAVEAGSDSTKWLDLWDVSVAAYRLVQAQRAVDNLDSMLEVLHAPEERRTISIARESIAALFEQREAELHDAKRRSTMYHERLGLEDRGEY